MGADDCWYAFFACLVVRSCNGAQTVTDLAKSRIVGKGPTSGGLADDGRSSAGAAPDVVVNNLSRTFTTKQGQSRPALANVNLTVPSGQFLSVIGASGCGKSTLLRLLGGLDQPTEGTVSIGGDDPSEVKGRGVIGLVPQSPALLPWKSVADNVALLDHLGPWSGRRLSPADIEIWLERVELENEGDLLPHQLSGGMQQRAALARAFAIEPSLLLMDEPFNALDEVTRHHMQSLLSDLRSLTKPTVVFVTHSIDEAVKLSDRVVMIHGAPGQIVADLAIELERPRASGIEDTPDFRRYTAAIRQALIGSPRGGEVAVIRAIDPMGTEAV
jgi:NitT/TauT family transport system ATP-binding protein